MKKIYFNLIIILFLFIINGCKDSSVSPTSGKQPTNNKIPDLALVPLSGNFQKILNFNASSDIDFGEVISTKSLYYLLVNNGSTDVFNVMLQTDSIEISPNSIALIRSQASPGFQSYPIIKFTMLHVIPSTGVGNYLPLKIGTVSGNIKLLYQYLGSNLDTLSVSKNFSFSGNKYATIVDLLLDGKKVQDWGRNRLKWTIPNYNKPAWVYGEFSSGEFSKIEIKNSGNTEIKIIIKSWNSNNVNMDTTLSENNIIDVTGILNENLNQGIYFGPTKYIINFAGNYSFEGEALLGLIIN